MSASGETAGIAAVVSGDHTDVFSFLGMHVRGDGTLTVRVFLPWASRVHVLDALTGKRAGELQRVHGARFFAGRPGRRRKPFPYRLRVETKDGAVDIEDPYRFPPLLDDLDVRLLAEGRHDRAYDKLGAHLLTMVGVEGVGFAVWAPNAKRVSVVGPFNDWDGRRHVMRPRHACGVWETFVPHIGAGEPYKYEIEAKSGEVLPLKADPFAFAAEQPSRTASIVHGADLFPWTDQTWMAERAAAQETSAPISIYEVHLGSWKRPEKGNGRYLTYGELADDLVPYARDMGFTHLEFLPVSEHPFDGSWGYQPVGLFAPSARFGDPDGFRHLVDRCHGAGLGVIVDWVPGHFPIDDHALGRFDGTHLYEHADPRKGRHLEWGTLVYDYGRAEVINFLVCNALFWLDAYHVDGLRVDAVASMLYLDYCRKPGEWIPNEFGGNENLEAAAFLKHLNDQIKARHPGTMVIAEESTAWPMVSRPTSSGGLGFDFKWNMGWMHDTLEFMGLDPRLRRRHLDKMTFGLHYVFSENFFLPLSHDEVVHEKRSLIGRMPGNSWQRFANLRAYYGFMYGHPGKKLLFMGGEFAQEREWCHDRGLDWHLLDAPLHRGIQTLIRDLNRLYRRDPALHEQDCQAEGFEWIDASDTKNSVLSFLRRGRKSSDVAVIVCNFTPKVHGKFRIGVPEPGFYAEEINTDALEYGGSGVGNLGGLHADRVPRHGRPFSLPLTLPPLATLILRPTGLETKDG